MTVEHGRVRATRGRAGAFAPTGTTRVGAVIGDPVRHSLSPVLYNAAFAELDLDWVFVAFEVPAGAARAALDAMRTLDIGWYAVTMPHKQDVARAVDELTPEAAALDSVNCVVQRDGRLTGHSTDGEGFVRALRAEVGFDLGGASCLVLGAGGAARAVVAAVAAAGAREVVVVNRTPANAVRAAELAGPAGRVGEQADVARADVVVNATPLGMGEDASLPLDESLLRGGQVVVDLVYEPEVTPLLRAARARGARPVGGLGMLVHQAALQLELVIGQPAPVEVMQRAARAALDAP